MKAHYKTSIAISLIVIIVLVILRTTVTGQDSIKFIDDTDDQPIDQQNSDSIDLRYSNEYQSWKQTGQAEMPVHLLKFESWNVKAHA